MKQQIDYIENGVFNNKKYLEDLIIEAHTHLEFSNLSSDERYRYELQFNMASMALNDCMNK